MGAIAEAAGMISLSINDEVQRIKIGSTPVGGIAQNGKVRKGALTDLRLMRGGDRCSN